MDFSIVVDASVAVKWYIKDESESDRAIDILLDYKEGKVSFVEPLLLYYEIANAVHIAVQRKRVTEDDGKDIIRDMLDLEMTFVDSVEMIRNAYGIARKYNISVYDAFYIEVAKDNGIMLYTGDKKFYNAVKDKKKFIKWIGEYERVDS